MIQGVLAQATVSDLPLAEAWYTRLFGRAPDAKPMPGLLEWHLGEGYGVQVWEEPERAVQSALVLSETDLDSAASRLMGVGITDDGPQQATSSRILPLVDPDGNRVVLVGD